MPCAATVTFTSSDRPAATRRCRSGPISRRQAPVETLKRLGATRGITRFVIVQPSFYGADNSATLDALDALGGQGRGVAVIDPKATRRTRSTPFHRRGVRGLRVNLYSPIKAPGGDTLEVGLRCDGRSRRAQMGWHVQVIAPLPVLLANVDACWPRRRCPWSSTITGSTATRGPDSADGRRLLDLVGLPHVWMKLSAPYRHDRGPLNTRPDREWLAALDRGRAGPLRLGQRLAASAGARAAEGRVD